MTRLLIMFALLWIGPARAEVIGGRPPGCPYQFCGCGASLYLFGRIIPELNRAASWFRFSRTSPAPGMAAVRNHHVMVLEAPTSRPGIWLVHDSNGGRHLTWRHARSIAGFVIVDPHSEQIRTTRRASHHGGHRA